MKCVLDTCGIAEALREWPDNHLTEHKSNDRTYSHPA